MNHRRVYASGVLVALLGLSACGAMPWTDAGSSARTQKASQQQKDTAKTTKPAARTVQATTRSGVHVVANPGSTSVLVNKYFKLPEQYVPKDLVDLDVPFIFSGKSEKKKMRAIAARPLENMFAAAKRDGVRLVGVSAYRSHKTQQALFRYYVNRDGKEKALIYSARPGTSEHETGLAIDVSGTDPKRAATPKFNNTAEAAWIATHAPHYGFIIRYPRGKEAITGYEYESWHLRYVGKAAAEEITAAHETLEEYLRAVPISK